jgi:hypothetical protein
MTQEAMGATEPAASVAVVPAPAANGADSAAK